MHLLLLGFTSSLGILALPLLHQAGHSLVAYVRSPDKIPGEYREWIDVVEGTLDEVDKVRALFERDRPFDAMLSCLGPSSRLYPPHPSGQPISCFYALLYQTLKTLKDESIGKFQAPRMIALGTLSQHNDAKDHFSLTAKAAETAIRIGSPTAYSDVKRWDHEIIAGSETVGAEWTIFRVGVLLTRGQSSPPVIAKTGYIGDGIVGVTLYRADAAVWLVEELAERKWIGELMVISS